jgi:hypothetical protein
MRFALGESHFGFLLVDLAPFIQVGGRTGILWSEVRTRFPVRRISLQRVISAPFNFLLLGSPLGGLPDVGNLDQGRFRDFRRKRPGPEVFSLL